MRFVVLLALLVGCPAPEKPRTPTPLAMIEASPDLDGKVVGASQNATIVVLMASWCEHCRAQLELLAKLREAHPNTRILGVNYKEHEEYDQRGDAVRLRAYIGEHVPWLRVVPADHALFRALGSPPFVPTIWIYDASGKYVVKFDRRDREPPTLEELENALAKLGG
jgi:thiol-disulfide isomerase/thioredoxin